MPRFLQFLHCGRARPEGCQCCLWSSVRVELLVQTKSAKFSARIPGDFRDDFSWCMDQLFYKLLFFDFFVHWEKFLAWQSS